MLCKDPPSCPTSEDIVADLMCYCFSEAARCVGEDAKLKQMLWVVENLQEELFRSQEYRLQAEKHQHRDRATIENLQVHAISLNQHCPGACLERVCCTGLGHMP